MKTNKGFTLAEVLITLVIIGVIAAMTIPTLMGSTNKQEIKTKAKKVISSVNQALALEYALYGNNVLNGGPDIWNDATPVSHERLIQMLSNHISIVDRQRDGDWIILTLADGNYLHLNDNESEYGYLHFFVGPNQIHCDANDIPACEKNGTNYFYTRVYCDTAPSHKICPASAPTYAYLYDTTIQEAVDKHNGNFWL